jgi:hypothetical protein
MAGTEQTFHYTKEEVRKMESRDSAAHGGNVSANSNASAMQVSSTLLIPPRKTLTLTSHSFTQSIVDEADKNKASIIEERRSNLPLPDAPPAASDFNSYDQSTTGVGSGSISHPEDVGRGQQTAGREGKDGLNGIPNDAVSRDAKNKAGLANTTGKDFNYPSNDPSSASS